MAEPSTAMWRRYLLIGLPIAAIIVVGLFYLFYPRTEYFYTDGDRTWQVDKSAPPRLIKWTALARLDEKVNAAPQTYEPLISPDGLQLYFTRGRAGADANIFVADRLGTQWGNPRPVKGINTPHDEIGAGITPDGRRMYFYSNRPGGQGGYDLWYSDKKGDQWQAPVNLGPGVNSAANEYDPSVSPDGKLLLFSSNRVAKAARGIWSATLRETKDLKDYDVYVLDLSAEEPAEPEPLTALNTSADEGQPIISPLGDFIYFASNREGGHGGYDIWRARIHTRPLKNIGLAENLGPEINSAGNELDPTVSLEGFHMYLASNREGEGEAYAIYHIGSREVFRFSRSWRPDIGQVIGKLGWPIVGLILTLLALTIMLFAFLKYRRKPGLLATCLGASIVLHLIALFIFNLYVVHQRISELGKGPKKYEVSVGKLSLEESLVSQEVRQKMLEMAMAEAKKLDEPKQIKIETAEPELVKAKPKMLRTDPNAPTRHEIEVEQMSKPEQRMQENIEAVVEMKPDVVERLHIQAKLLQAKVKPVKSKGVQVQDTQVAFRWSKPVGETAEAPAPKVFEPEIAHTPARSTTASLAEGKTRAVERKPVVDASVMSGIAASAVALAEPVRVRDTIATVARVRRARESSATASSARQDVNAGRSERSFAAAEGALGKPTVEVDSDVELVPVSTLVGMQTEEAQFPEAKAKTKTERLTSGTGTESTSQPVINVTESMVAVQTGKKTVATQPAERFGRSELATLKVEGPEARNVAFTSRPVEGASLEVTAEHLSLIKGGQWTQAASAPSAVAEGEAIDESVSGMALDAGSMEVLSGSLDMTSKQAEPVETEGGGEADRENKDGKENVEVVKAAHDEPNAGPPGRVVAAPRVAAAAVAADRAPVATEMTEMTVDAEAGTVEVASEIAMSADVQTAMAAFAVEVGPPPKTLPKAAKKLMYKLRKPEERKKIIKELGASEDTEKAVQAALEWLAKNQSDDGHWDLGKFKSAGQIGGQGQPNQAVAATGLSVLAFLGAGYTHTEGKHKDVVKKGLDWLLANQRADGYFFAGGRTNSMYGHGMATTALCEAYSMTQDANLVVAAQKSATLIMNSQKAPGGWRYQPESADSDTSVVGWQVLALKSAEIAGIPVPQKHYDGVAKWLDSVRHGTNGGLYNYAPGNAGGIAMTPEGWFCQLFISEGQKTRGMAESIKYVMGRLPSAWNKNAYYLYYATMALHLADAKESEQWNAAMAKMLLPMQRKDGAAAGSWNPDGFAYGGAGGRVYVTVMATLCLEVYYRYLPFYKQN